MKIVLLGSGNLATHLAQALQKAQHQIVQVWSRNKDHAEELALSVHAVPLNDIRNINTEADLYILAVKDDAISRTASQLILTDQLLVHTSGSTDIHILKGISENYGVLYPLQTFSKNKEINFQTVPIVVEGNKPEVANRLLAVSRQLSGNALELSSEKRMILHLAAVFACNFTNYMYTVSERILSEHDLKFDLLRPLITETAAKIQRSLPVEAQTGPAMRNDQIIINKHLDLLKNKSELHELYNKLSREITSFYRP